MLHPSGLQEKIILLVSHVSSSYQTRSKPRSLHLSRGNDGRRDIMMVEERILIILSFTIQPFLENSEGVFSVTHFG